MEEHGPNPIQLNGWKEIGAFFGKSTRTVQRWEANLRLPVRRIKTPGGEIVFALQRELEAWRDAGGGLADEGQDEVREKPAQNSAPELSDGTSGAASRGTQRAETSPRDTPVSRAGLMPHTSGRNAVVASAAALLLCAAVAAVWYLNRTGPVATADFRGNRVVAFDLAGREIWSYLFERPLWPLTRPANLGPGFDPGDPPVVADIDRDGLPEVLTIATYGQPSAGPNQQELICFSGEGSVLWTYRPAMSYSFAGRAFGAPWQFLDILVSRGAKEPAVWVSLASVPWWPTAVVRLDARGSSEVRLVSSGAVYRLAETTGPAGWHLLAGGVNNEYAAAALAVLDEHGPAAVSPQSADSAYHCDNCPSGAPRTYVTFPRTDINEFEGDKPYNSVWDIRNSDDGTEVVTLESRLHSAHCHYRLDRSLEVLSFLMSDSPAHRMLEANGRLSHAEADCPLTRMGVAVRVWTAQDGWRNHRVRPTRR